jgi:hypothetical protein
MLISDRKAKSAYSGVIRPPFRASMKTVRTTLESVDGFIGIHTISPFACRNRLKKSSASSVSCQPCNFTAPARSHRPESDHPSAAKIPVRTPQAIFPAKTRENFLPLSRSGRGELVATTIVFSCCGSSEPVVAAAKYTGFFREEYHPVMLFRCSGGIFRNFAVRLQNRM